ncbi:MAG TPA: YggT family protein [Candidatus Limnocylindria bacterium]|nr:YggT family protein [Candidatus Limnocylindria bacterium]
MTYPRDPGDPGYDDTRVVERRERVVEERPAGYPPQAPSANVNVAPASPGYAPAYVEPAAPGPLYYARRVLSLLFGILAALLVLRILLLALAANAGNPIVDAIYGITEPFVAPFRGIFSIDQVTPNGRNVLDFAAVVALIGWTLVYALIMAILGLADRREPA